MSCCWPSSDAGDDYLVLVRSSFAGYLADWLLDAALEFTAATVDRPDGAGSARPPPRHVGRSDHRADRPLEAQDVLAGEVVGPVGVAGGDGAQQRHVLRTTCMSTVDSRSRNMQWMRVARLS